MSKIRVSLLVVAISMAVFTGNVNAGILNPECGTEGWSVGFSPDFKGSPLVMVSYEPGKEGELNRLIIDSRNLPEGHRLSTIYLGVQNVVPLTTTDPGVSYSYLSQTPCGYAIRLDGTADVVTLTTPKDMEYRQLLTEIGAISVVDTDTDRYGGYYAFGAPISAVPEPEAYPLIAALGALGFGAVRKYRQRRAA